MAACWTSIKGGREKMASRAEVMLDYLNGIRTLNPNKKRGASNSAKNFIFIDWCEKNLIKKGEK